MLAALRRFVEVRWYGGIGLLRLLLPFTWLFQLISSIRRMGYSRGWFARPDLPVPVIVVGNISVGGTGKTPVVVWLVRQLEAAGFAPGIVSRGYGSKGVSAPELLTSEDAKRFGDEPVLLARLTGRPVCVGVDRAAAVKQIAGSGVNVVVADDGLQHYRMRRNFEIVVVDSDRGFGNGQVLPAGPLREPIDRVFDSDLVLINGGSTEIVGSEVPGIRLDAQAERRAQFKGFRLEQGSPTRLSDNVTRGWNEFAGERVWCVAAIGNPERFRRSLTERGLQIDVVELPDHGAVDLERLGAVRDQPVFMTEKDAVKYRDSACGDLWYVPVECAFSPHDVDEIIASLSSRLR